MCLANEIIKTQYLHISYRVTNHNRSAMRSLFACSELIYTNAVSVYAKVKKLFIKQLLIFLTTLTSGTGLLAVSTGISWWHGAKCKRFFSQVSVLTFH